MPAHEIFGETFRGLEARGRSGWTEGADARGLQTVDQSGGQRIVRTNNDETDFFPLRQGNDAIEIGRFDREIFCQCRGAGIAGRAEDAIHARRLGQLPNERVLAASPADNKNDHAWLTAAVRIFPRRHANWRTIPRWRKFLAASTEADKDRPRASPAAMAAESVHPLPCVSRPRR